MSASEGGATRNSRPCSYSVPKLTLGLMADLIICLRTAAGETRAYVELKRAANVRACLLTTQPKSLRFVACDDATDDDESELKWRSALAGHGVKFHTAAARKKGVKLPL